MNALRSRALVAGTAAALCVVVHPQLLWMREDDVGRAVVATMLLLLAAALSARAVHGGLGDRMLALGATTAVAALAWDGALGQRGSLRLSPGETGRNFVEDGPGGRPLGLRPLGFDVTLVSVRGDSADLLVAGTQATATRTQAVSAPGGVRLGRPRLAFTGDAETLYLTLTDATGERRLSLPANETMRHADLEIGLERYFPEFALDPNNQPFSRGDEPRRPAAVLTVLRGSQSYRAFALAGAPGIHQVDGLGVSFALSGVLAQQQVGLRTAHLPGAWPLFCGLLLAGAGLLRKARETAPPLHPAAPGAALGAMLCVAVAALGDGGALRWAWAANLDATPIVVPAAGMVLGTALLSSLAGTLLVVTPILASGALAPPRPIVVGHKAQILGGTLAMLGAALLLVETGLDFGAGHEAALVLLLAGALAAALACDDPRSLPSSAAAAVLLLLAVVGIASWLRAGDYDTAAFGAAASVALFALAASE